MAKQNKFTKSVKERLEMEVNSDIKERPLPTLDLPEGVNEEHIPIKEVITEPLPDLSAFLENHPQRQAKNKTFYLDRDVVDAIRKTAKTQKTTESRLVNDILRKVLGVG